MEIIDILEKLVSFNTIEDKENKEIIHWIESFLKEYGFKCKKIYNSNRKKCCMIAQIGKNPIIAFSGHLDTVNATEDWKRDPFSLSIEENRIYGLGVCDMKGGIASFLKACSSINKEKLKNGLKLYLTYDEEIGFEGIKLLLEKNTEFPKYLILAEPTDLKPVFATKGCMEMKVTFYGKSSHSSTPNQGKNAIIEAYRFIGELLEFSEKIKKEENLLFSIPYTTMNIGRIKGGDAINKVPDRCYIEFDARTVYEKHNKLVEENIKKILKKYDAKLHIGINIPANINHDNEMIDKVKEFTEKQSESKNYVTEASFIPSSETIILGVGPDTSHQSDEYIEKEKLEKLVEIYEKIIESYCM